MFVVLLKYLKPLEEVEKLLPAHAEFLKACYGRSEFICSGRRNPRIGGVILANVPTEQKVWDLIRQDPFFVHQIASYEVIEFTPTLYDQKFACFVESFF